MIQGAPKVILPALTVGIKFKNTSEESGTQALNSSVV
jgi:hypothetical protein